MKDRVAQALAGITGGLLAFLFLYAGREVFIKLCFVFGG